MRVALVLLMAVCVASAQTCPPFPQLSDNGPYTEHWFAGSIGKRDVRMSLSRGGDAVVGVLYYTDDWKPIMLGGQWKEHDAIEMHNVMECSADFCYGDTLLKGNLNEKGFVGLWQPTGHQRTLPLNLRKVPEPSCKGDGPRRVFKNSEWPITFSYPASWHLEVKKDELNLICPNATFMAYEDLGTIQITRGEPWGKDASGDIPIQKCGENWLPSYPCGCGDPDCSYTGERLSVNQNDGLTIINQEGGSLGPRRSYCTQGGYVGAEDGDDIVLLLDKQMIWITGGAQTTDVANSLVKSVMPRR